MMADEAKSEKLFDLLLKGGHVIDPANSIDKKMDVGIKDKKIVQVAPDIPASDSSMVVDVSEHYVTPGILDIHTHVYTFKLTDSYYVMSLNADAHRMVLRGCEQDINEMNPEIAAALAKRYPDVIVGIKTAHYWTKDPWDEKHPPWASVESAVEAGNICGKPVMVDFWPRPPERSYSDLILKKLRPGDIHTHVFAQQFPILDENGKVSDFLFQARDRGVIFDLGHGAGSFWFRNGVPALKQGFPPDSISTDLHMGNINGPVVSMLETMSKYLSMGMPLQEVIMRSTVTPAKEINRPELGTLGVGSEADVAVLKRLKGKFGFTDCGRAKMIGKEKLECVVTVRAGRIVYDPTGLSMPEWENAPEAYWKTPKLQS